MRRLIEGDLPIGRVSAHASREKSLKRGRISGLHIWWATRPLAACRAVILGALLPDPMEHDCPADFLHAARGALVKFALEVAQTHRLMEAVGSEAATRWTRAANEARQSQDAPWKTPEQVRQALLDFIGDAAACEMSLEPVMFECARALVDAAHPDGKPLVLDPFAGGGAIPLEALRVGADSVAMDLNPVAVLLLKMVLEESPRHGARLVDEARRWGAVVKEEAEKDIGCFYPKDKDGSVPIAYLWARTVKCDEAHGGCGAEVPLIRQLWLARKGRRSIALKMVPKPRAKRVDFEIVEGIKEKDVQEGTVRRGNAVCPLCHHTTPVASVRTQLKARRGGAGDARMLAVVSVHPAEPGRRYRLPRPADLEAAAAAEGELKRHIKAHKGLLSLVPDEPLPPGTAHRAVGSQLPLYGFETWGDLFTPRQAQALVTFVGAIRKARTQIEAATKSPDLSRAVTTLLALALDRAADVWASLCTWNPQGEKTQHTFGRQSLAMVWDFCEAAPFGGSVGEWSALVETAATACETARLAQRAGRVQQGSATTLSFPDDAVDAVVTDPPYYDAIPYSDLADFFYVWLKRAVGDLYPDLFRARLTPKAEEIVVHHAHVVDAERGVKDRASFETGMAHAMREARRVLRPEGIGVVVFAHKSTSGWEAMLKAMIDAGWKITASWPIDTEMGTRLVAMGTASLASSVHIVCRPRPPGAGTGDWREVSAELEPRIREWMGRLVKEGIVGADAIFACIGPALEIFSRYEKVEKPDGKEVTLREYLEEVWKVVGKHALASVSGTVGVDTTGFDEDARITALWLWTVKRGMGGEDAAPTNDKTSGVTREFVRSTRGEEDEGDREQPTKAARGLTLEYDAARKLAQGIGAHLEDLAKPGGVVEVDGETAYLVPVRERRGRLLGEDQRRAGASPAPTRAGKAGGEDAAPTLPGAVGEAVRKRTVEVETDRIAEGAETVLDRVHQAMLLFADNRSEALKRFLTEGGPRHGGQDPAAPTPAKDERFRAVAQALSALYPPSSEEKRWVDGMLGRVKVLGM